MAISGKVCYTKGQNQRKGTLPVKLTIVLFLLPLWDALFYLYFEAKRQKLRRAELVTKCAGTFLSVLSCGLGLALSEVFPLAQPFFWFFFLCMAADLLLELHFLTGMLVFAGAHACAIWTMAGEKLISLRWSLPLWLLLIALGCVLFRRELSKMKGKAVPFVLYYAVLASAAACALPAVLVCGNAQYLFWTVGMACFFCSDLMVAKSALSYLDPKWEKLVMLLYWAALLLISLWVW